MMKLIGKIQLAIMAAMICLGGAIPAAAAKEIVIACAPLNPSSQNWVPKAILIKIDPDTDRAAVLDDFTLQVFEGGMRAEISRPTPTRIKLDWKLIGAKNNQGRKQNVAFKMTINMKKMTFNYDVVADSSYVRTVASKGRCLPVPA